MARSLYRKNQRISRQSNPQWRENFECVEEGRIGNRIYEQGRNEFCCDHLLEKPGTMSAEARSNLMGRAGFNTGCDSGVYLGEKFVRVYDRTGCKLGKK